MQAELNRAFSELSNIVRMTETVFEQSGLSPELRNVVDLATEELFVNMVSYNTETTSKILFEMSADAKGIEVSLTDYDVDRFDPTEASQIDVNAPLGDRTPGGLGVYLVLKMVDSIHYQYCNRQSKITFIVNRN